MKTARRRDKHNELFSDNTARNCDDKLIISSFLAIIKSANKKSIGNERKIADLIGSPKMAKQKDRRANAGQIERV